MGFARSQVCTRQPTGRVHNKGEAGFCSALTRGFTVINRLTDLPCNDKWTAGALEGRGSKKNNRRKPSHSSTGETDEPSNKPHANQISISWAVIN